MKISQSVKGFNILLLSCLITSVMSTNEVNNSTIVITKCCDVNHIIKDDICIFSNTSGLVFSVYENETKISTNVSYFYNNSTQCKTNPEDCVKLQPDELFFLQNDGTLWLPSHNIFIENGRYCIEYFEDDDGVSAILYSNEFDESDGGGLDTPSLIGATLSAPFLLVTFIVYALLPERNFHGMCLMCYVFALFWSFFLAIIVYNIPSKILDHYLLCQIGGKLIYYFLLSFFFWMNAISFDICSTFSGLSGFSAKKNIPDRKRFLMYSIYAWGVPLLLVIFYISLGYVFSHDAWYNPGVGCWIYVEVSQLLIFYGPVVIVIAANIIFYVITTLKIKQAQNQISLLKSKDSKKHFKNEDKQRFFLYLRLLFGMGINWSIRFIVWIIHLLGVNFPYVVWEIAAYFDCTYGVFIFFIFVFKRSIWNSLKTRFYMIEVKSRPRHSPDVITTEIP